MYEIIIFGEDWGGLNSTAQYLAKELVKHNRVIWVNSIGLRSPTFNIGDLKRIFKKLTAYLASLYKPKSNIIDDNTSNSLTIAKPIAIPYLRYSFIRKLNRLLVTRYLNTHVFQVNGKLPRIIITACPATVDIVDQFHAKKIIYYCADKHSSLPGMDKKLVDTLENELIAKCDLVLATSKLLYEELFRIHKNVRYFPHGVNYLHLKKALATSSDTLPLNIPSHNKPVVGYIGLIGEHLDFQLIEFLAANLTGCSFVFCGPIQHDVHKVPTMANIFYTGKINYERAPDYLAYFDVCILPWKKSTRNDYANPTKLKEYLAAGKMVVSTAHPEIEHVANAIYTCNSNESCLQELRKALLDKENDVTNPEVISLTQEKSDWSFRANELTVLINELLSKQ